MGMVKLALKSPYAVAVMALLILVIGAVSISRIAVDILPVFKAPAVQVMTYFSGMPTASIEKTITNRIERWTNQATGCQRVESKSTLGVSVVRLYFQDDIDPNGALTQVNSLALGTLPTLPPNTLPPVVVPFDPTGTLPLGVLTVSSPSNSGLDETALKDLARIEIRNMLGGVKGVVAPAVFGGKDRTILVYVNPKELQARRLSPLDVVDALSRQNFMVTPGVAKFGGYEFQLDSNAMVSAVDELNKIPIRTDPGNRVYLDRHRPRQGHQRHSDGLGADQWPPAGVRAHLSPARGQHADRDRRREARAPADDVDPQVGRQGREARPGDGPIGLRARGDHEPDSRRGHRRVAWCR